LVATRKRTLRRATARRARSVWSKCQSRVIESRKKSPRQGLPILTRGDSIALHTIRRHRHGARATCSGTRPGSESRAEAHGGILESWESRTAATEHCRARMTPAHQHPGARAELSAARASETAGSARAPVSEGNRSERADGGGSRSGLIVAVESRRTGTGGSR
jgi:hypothetical protein